jgi:hypothetical protein
MTILSVCQDAARLLLPTQAPPTTIFSSSANPFAVELRTLANEGATAIFEEHDWQKQLTLKTQTGDAVTTAFDLPSDFNRMPIKANVFLSSTSLPMVPIRDLDVWLDHRLRTFGTVHGEWMIIGGKLNIYPVMSASQSAKYYYLSNLTVTANDASTKAAFSADADTWRLPERLLTLDLIWRWRHRKGLSYAEDLRNFQIAQSKAIKADKGSHVLSSGRPRTSSDATPAFPGTVNA